MHFHAVVAFLFETFEHIDAPEGNDDPARVVTRSKACFETILRLYYLRHGFEQYDAMLLQFLLTAAFSTMRKLKEERPDPDVRQQLLSTLILCAKGLWEQGRNCYASEASFHYLKDSLTAEDAALVVREVPDFKEDKSRKAIMLREIRSQWPLGVSHADMKPVDQCLSTYLRGEAAWR